MFDEFIQLALPSLAEDEQTGPFAAVSFCAFSLALMKWGSRSKKAALFFLIVL